MQPGCIFSNFCSNSVQSFFWTWFPSSVSIQGASESLYETSRSIYAYNKLRMMHPFRRSHVWTRLDVTYFSILQRLNNTPWLFFPAVTACTSVLAPTCGSHPNRADIVLTSKASKPVADRAKDVLLSPGLTWFTATEVHLSWTMLANSLVASICRSFVDG